MYIRVSFPGCIWFPYGKSNSFVPLCSVEKQALFLRTPTTLKDSEMMAIFPIFALTTSLPFLSQLSYARCLCPDFILYCFPLQYHEIIMYLYCIHCLCIYVPLLFFSTSSQDSFTPWLTVSLNKPFLVIYLNLFKEKKNTLYLIKFTLLKRFRRLHSTTWKGKHLRIKNGSEMFVRNFIIS